MSISVLLSDRPGHRGRGIRPGPPPGDGTFGRRPAEAAFADRLLRPDRLSFRLGPGASSARRLALRAADRDREPRRVDHHPGRYPGRWVARSGDERRAPGRGRARRRRRVRRAERGRARRDAGRCLHRPRPPRRGRCGAWRRREAQCLRGREGLSRRAQDLAPRDGGGGDRRVARRAWPLVAARPA